MNGPNITSLEPSIVTSLETTSSIFFTIQGSNFSTSSMALLDGSPVTTVFVNSTTLSVLLLQDQLPGPGTYQFTVTDSTGSSNSFSVTVYSPAQGPLPFKTSAAYETGMAQAFQPVVTADVDGDGRADVITSGVTLSGQLSIAVLHGQADGTLAAPQYFADSDLDAIAVGDVNGDGSPDIVSVALDGFLTSELTVLVNDGRGSFSQASKMTFTGLVQSPIALADIFGSGNMDLLAVTQEPGGISLFKNLGNGKFAAPVLLGSPPPPLGVLSFAVADFNNDGLSDIAFENEDSSVPVQLFLNQGNGTFTTVMPAALSSTIGMPISGDFNGDGCADLAVQVTSNPLELTLATFLGNCDATFNLVSTMDLGPFVSAPFAFSYGDFDHDGHPDLVGVAGGGEPSTALVLFGDGLGNFTQQKIIGPVGFFSAAGDVNGDGPSDIAVGDGEGHVSITLGRTDRNFPEPTSLAPHTTGVLSVGDVNHDGLPDLLIGGDTFGGTPGSIFLNLGDGEFELAGSPPADGQVLADLNGDGFPDLIGTFGAQLSIWPGTGDPNYPSSPITITLPTSEAFRIADIDGDGNPDIVFADHILFGDGKFDFTSVALMVASNSNFVVGDFNGDGLPDIAETGATFLNQGGRSFSMVSYGYRSPCISEFPVVGDFNGDGKLDVASINADSPEIYVCPGGGDGTLTLQSILNAGEELSGITAADFNHDGRTDIVVSQLTSQPLALFTSTSTGEFQLSYFVTGALPVQITSADLNQDGKPDLAIVNFGFDFAPPNAVLVFGQ